MVRGGLYGQAEVVLYGGRGPAALEVYWDGIPYIPLGRDSVYIDPARIPLAPLERVEVVLLPASLRVYLVSARQRSTATTTEIGVTTGNLSTAEYRALFLKRWRSGIGLSLITDWSNITGAATSPSTTFRDVDLWFKTEYVPTGRWGVALQILSSDWRRESNAAPLVNPFNAKRQYNLLQAFIAHRADGLGPRADLALAYSTMSGDTTLKLITATSDTTRDTTIVRPDLGQASLTLSSRSSRALAALTARVAGANRPYQFELQTGWTPLHPVTISADARYAHYDPDRSGARAHVAVGIVGPLGLSLRGDAAWESDVAAPALPGDTTQETNDLFGAIRWDTRWLMVEVGAARRGAFTPPDSFAAGLRSVGALAATPQTNYLTVQGTLRLIPALQLSGWYFEPVRGGGDFEPPRHARYSATFYSKFWRVYRSGIFALRAEAAGESWSRGGPAGVTVSGPQFMGGNTFVTFDVQIQIAGVTIYWALRNARSAGGGYEPGVPYPGNYQTYGVRWRFTN